MWTLIALAFVVTTPDYDAFINDLAGDPLTALAAHRALRDAGVDAFPVLAKRTADRTVIRNDQFSDDEAVQRTSQGHWVRVRPRIGEVTFRLIQSQVEGRWYKPFRDHYALDPSNVAKWLADNNGLSITQLRIRAFADSMDSLSREIEDSGVNAMRLTKLKFLRLRLDTIVADAENSQ